MKRRVSQRRRHGKASYPRWVSRRSNEAFDRAQSLAYELTDEDRRAGRPAPSHGYSEENFKRAERIVREAQS